MSYSSQRFTGADADLRGSVERKRWSLERRGRMGRLGERSTGCAAADEGVSMKWRHWIGFLPGLDLYQPSITASTKIVDKSWSPPRLDPSTSSRKRFDGWTEPDGLVWRGIEVEIIGEATLDENAALPHNSDLCESSQPGPTNAPFASSCRKRTARKWRRRSLPTPAERLCSGEREGYASCVGQDRDGESEVESGRFTSITQDRRQSTC